MAWLKNLLCYCIVPDTYASVLGREVILVVIRVGRGWAGAALCLVRDSLLSLSYPADSHEGHRWESQNEDMLWGGRWVSFCDDTISETFWSADEESRGLVGFYCACATQASTTCTLIGSARRQSRKKLHFIINHTCSCTASTKLSKAKATNVKRTEVSRNWLYTKLWKEFFEFLDQEQMIT